MKNNSKTNLKIASLTIIIVAIALYSCSIFRTLTSVTTIEPNNSFVLGQGEHGSYTVHLENTSKYNLNLILTNLEGISTAPTIVKANEKTTLKVDKNTKLTIENNSNSKVNVKLLVKGDTNLSMGYKN